MTTPITKLFWRKTRNSLLTRWALICLRRVLKKISMLKRYTVFLEPLTLTGSQLFKLWLIVNVFFWVFFGLFSCVIYYMLWGSLQALALHVEKCIAAFKQRCHIHFFFWLSARSRSLTTISTVLFSTLICPQPPSSEKHSPSHRQIVEPHTHYIRIPEYCLQFVSLWLVQFLPLMLWLS